MGQRSFDFDSIFDKPGPLTVAYGMGTDSTAMICELVRRNYRPDAITFADTGGEHPRTYAYFQIINNYLRRHDFPTVTVVKYVPRRFKNQPYTTLEGNCISNATLPSLAFGRKSCSIKWKSDPQEKFLTKYWPPGKAAVAAGIPIRRLIGYDASPKDSKRGAVKPNPQFEYAYPLRTWGFDREHCIQIIERAGLPNPGKSACFYCPASKPHELIDLATHHPDLAARALAMEDNARPNLKVIEGLGGRKTKKRSGSWRQFFESNNLLDKIENESTTQRTVTNSVEKCEIVPGLKIYHA